MTLTAIVGALVALVPAFHPKGDRVKEAPVDDKTHPRFIAGYDAGLNDGRLEREDEAAASSRAADDLNRDLAIQRALVDHWQGQARILAQALRREREGNGYEAQRQIAYAQAAGLQQQLAQYNQQAAMQAQHYAGPLGQQQGFEGFCNCVPSRAQVWGASHGLVQEVDGLVNRLNQILG